MAADFREAGDVILACYYTKMRTLLKSSVLPAGKKAAERPNNALFDETITLVYKDLKLDEDTVKLARRAMSAGGLGSLINKTCWMMRSGCFFFWGGGG